MITREHTVAHHARLLRHEELLEVSVRDRVRVRVRVRVSARVGVWG